MRYEQYAAIYESLIYVQSWFCKHLVDVNELSIKRYPVRGIKMSRKHMIMRKMVSLISLATLLFLQLKAKENIEILHLSSYFDILAPQTKTQLLVQLSCFPETDYDDFFVKTSFVN